MGLITIIATVIVSFTVGYLAGITDGKVRYGAWTCVEDSSSNSIKHEQKEKKENEMRTENK